MEALKSIILIALGIGILLTWSASKRYSIVLKSIVTLILSGLLCVSWFIWPGKPFTNNNNITATSSGTDASNVMTEDVPSDSKPMLTISGSSVINDALTVELAKSYMLNIGCTDISVAVDKEKKEKYVIGVKDGNKIRFDIKSPGTKDGFLALQNQKADICMASAQGEPEFRETTNENVIGLDGIAVVTNSNNPIQGICKEDLSDIYTGKIKDWSAVSGSSITGQIHLYRMGDKTGIYKMFKELVLSGQDINGTKFDKSQEMVDAIGKDANGIGFVSYTFLAKSNNIKSIPVSDARGISPISPNALTISSEKYPLCRRLYMYRPVSGYKPEVNGFINFVKSDDGQKIVESVGFINLNISNDDQITLSKEDPLPYRNLQKTHTKISSELRFIFGTDNLDSRGYDDIDRLVSRLGQPGYRGKSVVLVGFTDNTGTMAVNQSLSEKRAKSLVNDFTNKGIIIAKTMGMGMLHPVRDNSSEQARAYNRRVEVWIEK